MPESLPDRVARFSLLHDGDSEFRVRLSLMQRAARHIDVQYYQWARDRSGRRLARSLLRAAQRGVRVRLLVDDVHVGKDIAWLAALASHPRIQVRVFNPLLRRRRWLLWWRDIARIHRRMHNKMLLVDKRQAIVGGRNTSDRYFGRASDANFRDLGVYCEGAVVAALQSAFERYWQSDAAIDADQVAHTTAIRLQYHRLRLKRGLNRRPGPVSDDTLQAVERALVPAHYQLAVDSPEKTPPSHDAPQPHPLARVAACLADNSHELLIETAYFIPTEAGIRCLQQWQQRGIRVSLLTNGLASNDSLLAHAGYARYRHALICAGVKLYEFKPDAFRKKRWWSRMLRGSRARLHTKAVVIDRQRLLTGSFNLDPRSQHLNTELSLCLSSPVLAEAMASQIRRGMRPAMSYRVCLEHGRLVWHSQHQGNAVSYHRDPGVGWWQRLMIALLMRLPLQHWL